MATNIEQTLIEKVRALPPEKQRELLNIVEDLTQPSAPARMTIWDEVDEITKDVPPEAWDELPTDGSVNVDHYLYGAPKRQ
ncbi:MAG: hypothetical protein MSG64_13785 [Pyrinomonadaceae bacterium MAG19_C2-C3]|nr:hypothetical protein [Pyrinomonadaceae bacterium MAG19_C2-C3]